MGCCCFCAAARVAAAVALVGFVLWERQTNAALLTFNVTESPSLANYANREVAIPEFNPSLGQLQSVTIDFHGTGAFLQGFQHPGAPHRDLLIYQNLSIVLETQNGQKLITLNQTPTRIAHGLGIHEGAGGGGLTGPTIHRVVAAGQKTLTSEEELMQFTGDGIVDLYLSAHDGMGDRISGRPSLLNGLWMVGANITVDYDYLAVPGNSVVVPEPSSWLAAGFALLVLAFTGAPGILMRRSQARSVGQ